MRSTNILSWLTGPGTGPQLLTYDDITPVDAGEQRFYRVRAVSVYGLTSSASNGIGLFSFALAPGGD